MSEQTMTTDTPRARLLAAAATVERCATGIRQASDSEELIENIAFIEGVIDSLNTALTDLRSL